MSKTLSVLSISSESTKKQQETLMDGNASSNQQQSQQLLTITPTLLQLDTDKKEYTLVVLVHKSTIQHETLLDNSASRNQQQSQQCLLVPLLGSTGLSVLFNYEKVPIMYDDPYQAYREGNNP